MNDLRKVNSLQLYYLWRNLAIALLCIAMTVIATHMLPHYMAPVVSLFFCSVLYTMMWNDEHSPQPGCMIMPQIAFFSLLVYSFLNIVLVIMHVMHVVAVPDELMFFNQPFMPALTLLPITFLSIIFTMAFRLSTPVCSRCHARSGGLRDRGYFGFITSRESRLQLKNVAVLFALLSVVVWWYYLDIYVNVNQNGRDWYMFVWLIVLLIVIDEVYFIMRYYNLYLDFLEHNEIITPDEIRDMTACTYLRYYLICGEYVYVDKNAYDRVAQRENVLDTPFTTKKTMNGIHQIDVRKIIESMAGVTGGELKFFFGRHVTGNNKVSVLRYFYFLDGEVEDYNSIEAPGYWIHFRQIQLLYKHTPNIIGTNGLNDLSRLFTIMMTERDFDENGVRKNQIRSYRRSITLADVRKTQIDLQDDKWIHIAHFNSDIKFYKFKKLMRNMFGRKRRSF
ncbi:MAG: hypothetical protein Q4C37_04605 [Bacteroidales bacterium]|nr:hypothetical protein [Bacteroidales bacterium]